MYALLHLAALTATVLLLARALPAVRVKSAGTAVVVALVFSLLNVLLGWLIRALLVVPAILTLGLLFLFVPFIVNLVLLWITDKLIAAFEIRTTGALLASAGAITLVNGVFFLLVHAQRMGHLYQPHPRWI